MLKKLDVISVDFELTTVNPRFLLLELNASFCIQGYINLSQFVFKEKLNITQITNMPVTF